MRPRILLAASLVMGLGRSARACMNDRESPSHEREFRSNYGEPEPYRPQPVASPPPLMASWSDPALTGIGGVLLTSACFLAVRPRAEG